jgi:hypothetical protein
VLEQKNIQWCSHNIIVDLKTACMGYDPVPTTEPIMSEQFSPPPSHLEIYQPPQKTQRVRKKENVKGSQIGICFIAIKFEKTPP